jgi:hypothetical protein
LEQFIIFTGNKMNELNRNQKIAYSSVATGVGGVAAHYGIKNWKKNGWWKTLAVIGVIQATGGAYNLAISVAEPKNEK